MFTVKVVSLEKIYLHGDKKGGIDLGVPAWRQDS